MGVRIGGTTDDTTAAFTAASRCRRPEQLAQIAKYSSAVRPLRASPAASRRAAALAVEETERDVGVADVDGQQQARRRTWR
jgi:hypothetical protein